MPKVGIERYSRTRGELWKGNCVSSIVPEAKRLLEKLSIASRRDAYEREG